MSQTYTFDQRVLIPQLKGIIQKYSAGRPSLVFCNSRVICQKAGAALKDAFGSSLVRDPALQKHLASAASSIGDASLSAMVRCGVAYHDASLDAADRQRIEALFREGALPVVAATCGLAQGVNLPARLVVVMNTAKYVPGAGVHAPPPRRHPPRARTHSPRLYPPYTPATPQAATRSTRASR